MKFLHSQRNDPEYQEVIITCENNGGPDRDFYVENRLLYKRTKENTGL